MKNTEITLESMSTMSDTTKKIIDGARKMTDSELDLLIRIIDLIKGRPDRREMALSWTGRMADLPEALAQI